MPPHATRFGHACPVPSMVGCVDGSHVETLCWLSSHLSSLSAVFFCTPALFSNSRHVFPNAKLPLEGVSRVYRLDYRRHQHFRYLWQWKMYVKARELADQHVQAPNLNFEQCRRQSRGAEQMTSCNNFPEHRLKQYTIHVTPVLLARWTKKMTARLCWCPARMSTTSTQV